MAIPVTLDDAKRQLRYEAGDTLSADRTAEINGFIADAAAWVENYTGHILVARDVTQAFDGFKRLDLAAWPVHSGATLTVTYLEPGAQVPVSVSALTFVGVSRPACALPSLYPGWPVVPAGTLVSVTVRAGYEPTDLVPGNFRRAMLVLISAYDSDREGGALFAQAEESAKSLCRQYRARGL